MTDIILPKISSDDEDEITAPMELDLIAYFKALESDVLTIIENNTDKTLDEIIHEITKLFEV